MGESPESSPMIICEPREIDLVASINRSLEKVPSSQSRAPICKVIPSIRGIRPSEYEPHTVAIGPYNHGKEHLRDTEELKLSFFKDLLNRNLSKTVADYVGKIKEQEERIRNSYADGLRTFDSDTVVRIMTVDSCFLVEFAIKFYGESNPAPTSQGLGRIFRDLFLLENQVPFFLLDQVWKVLGHNPAIQRDQIFGFRPVYKEGDVNLHKLFLIVAAFCASFEVFSVDSDSYLEITRQPDHLLDLLHHIIFPAWSPPEDGFVLLNSSTLPCASELKMRGLRFAKAEYTLDAAFLSFAGGEIRMPRVNVFDDTSSILRNLIAYEQCIHGVELKVSSFVLHFSEIVRTEADTSVLRRSGILNNGLGSDVAIAELFTELGKGVIAARMNEVCRDIVGYYKSRRAAWMAELRAQYLASPWKATAVLAAALLLMLTVIQTVFAVLSYIHTSTG